MIIKAKHNPLVVSFFNHYSKKKIRRNFHQVVLKGNIDVSKKSVLLLSNHFSWWDGFWALYLNIKLFKKKFHFMMDEKELSKRWLFSYVGGFSVARHNKSIVESIHYATEQLNDINNLVLIYPQGKLYSSYCNDISFMKGISRISTTDKTKVVYLVQFTDYFQHAKPTVYFYLQEADKKTLVNNNYEEQYRAFYKTCLEEQSKIII
jgi:1-acyl-sn-glycerol-3-phosphate acyltransferase